MERKVIRVEPKIPQREKALRVAAYCRVSSDKDAMLHSLSAQVSYFSECIQKHNGWIFCGVYYDEAKTGTKDNRQGFMALLEKCKKGEIDMILTKSVSRFSRNALTLLATVRELKALGVSVQFDEENINTLTEDGEFMLSLIASVAQEESRSASDNQKWRIQKCYERGEDVNTRRLFGYDIKGHTFTPNEEEAPIVREIFDRVIKGESFYAIAKDLRSRGVSGKHGGTMTGQRIGEIIANERYVGDSIFQKKFVNNHLQKKLYRNHGELPKFYAEGTHEGIIPRSIFEAANALKQERKASLYYETPSMHTAFSQFIECETCGKKYKRAVRHGDEVWNCSTFIKYGKTHCWTKQIPSSVLKCLCMDVLGLNDFDENIVRERVEKISVPKKGLLVFHLATGKKVTRQWENAPLTLKGKNKIPTVSKGKIVWQEQ